MRAVNGELEDHPSLANEDPYHEGWLIEVELDDESELEDLMATEEYEEFVARRRGVAWARAPRAGAGRCALLAGVAVTASRVTIRALPIDSARRTRPRAATW